MKTLVFGSVNASLDIKSLRIALTWICDLSRVLVWGVRDDCFDYLEL